MTQPETLIPVGKIVATHGVKGLLKVHSFSGNVKNLQQCGSLTIRSRDGVLSKLEVQSIIPRSQTLLMGFQGLDDINQAQQLIGSEICLERGQFPEPEEDEYYWCDLIGLRVFTVSGEELGEVGDIFEAGSSDIYVVRGAGKEYLIPAIADVISSIDLTERRIVVTPLEGLLDL